MGSSQSDSKPLDPLEEEVSVYIIMDEKRVDAWAYIFRNIAHGGFLVQG